MRRYGNRRDVNEQEIVDALEAIGATVCRLDRPVDLLVGYRARCFLIEVKAPNGRLTRGQREFMRRWKGQVRVVETPEDAIDVVTHSYVQKS